MKGNLKGAVAARVIALALAIMLLTGSALASMKAYVYSDSMKVYSKATTSSKKLGSLKEGTAFYITRFNSTWCEINYKGYKGYAKWKDIEVDEDDRVKCYTSKKASVYKYASSSSGKLGTVSAGTTAYAAGRSGNYFMVQNKSGSITGYIHKNYLTTTKPKGTSSSASTSGSSSAAANSGDSRTKMPSELKSSVSSYSSSYSDSQKLEYAIYVAQNQLGKKYSSDPTAPRTYDCAGLMYYCFKKIGEKIPASAYSQGYDDDYEKITSTSGLKRGDIVCFNTNSTDDDLSDHTGIYIGGGKFIHASSGAGMVIVSDLTSGYYSRTFSWGRRILD